MRVLKKRVRTGSLAIGKTAKVSGNLYRNCIDVEEERKKFRLTALKSATDRYLFKERSGQILQKQLKERTELYITPSIHIVSSLPSVILAFSFVCTQMNNLQRHILLAAYLFSYIPSMLGFVVYVLPSSMYKKEFMETSLGKKYIKIMHQ